MISNMNRIFMLKSEGCIWLNESLMMLKICWWTDMKPVLQIEKHTNSDLYQSTLLLEYSSISFSFKITPDLASYFDVHYQHYST